MNRIRYFAILTIIALFAAAAYASAPAPAGKVDDLAGQAVAQTGQDQPRKLAKGAAVYASDVISTPTASDKARIAFEDGSVLEVGPESSVALKDFSFDETGKDKSSQVIAMGKGMFRFVTGKVVAQNPDNLKIESPLSVIGIRGTTTDHWIRFKPDGQLDSELHSLRETHTGSEVVVDAEGKQLVLNRPGQAAWVRPNIPGSVRDLTDEEKQAFGKAPIKRSPFDPPVRAGFVGGAN